MYAEDRVVSALKDYSKALHNTIRIAYFDDVKEDIVTRLENKSSVNGHSEICNEILEIWKKYANEIFDCLKKKEQDLQKKYLNLILKRSKKYLMK